jgi:hypothetical protein
VAGTRRVDQPRGVGVGEKALYPPFHLHPHILKEIPPIGPPYGLPLAALCMRALAGSPPAGWPRAFDPLRSALGASRMRALGRPSGGPGFSPSEVRDASLGSDGLLWPGSERRGPGSMTRMDAGPAHVLAIRPPAHWTPDRSRAGPPGRSTRGDWLARLGGHAGRPSLRSPDRPATPLHSGGERRSNRGVESERRGTVAARISDNHVCSKGYPGIAPVAVTADCHKPFERIRCGG